MEVVRTVRVKLDYPLDAAREYVRSFTSACNTASVVGFGLKRPSNAMALQGEAYGAIREGGLPAQVAVSVCRTVSARYAALKTAKVKPSKPVAFKAEPVRLQGGERGRDFGFTKDGRVSISTPHGRMKVRYFAHPLLGQYLEGWQLGGGLLLVKDNKVYLLVSFKKDVQPLTAPNDSVVGVDRGLNYVAVITDGKRSVFVAGGEVLDRRRRYQAVKASVQSRKAQRPTSSLRKLLQRLSGREARYCTDVDHRVSKSIVQFAKQTGSPAISIESLEGIRSTSKIGGSVKKKLHRWSFYRLASFIEYKAASEGMSVIGVDPRYTSQGCSRCGHTERANRSGHRFVCKACGYSLHSDLNAARNIRLRGIVARQALGDGGAVSAAPEVAALDRAPDGLPGDKPPALAVGC